MPVMKTGSFCMRSMILHSGPLFVHGFESGWVWWKHDEVLKPRADPACFGRVGTQHPFAVAYENVAVPYLRERFLEQVSGHELRLAVATGHLSPYIDRHGLPG